MGLKRELLSFLVADTIPGNRNLPCRLRCGEMKQELIGAMAKDCSYNSTTCEHASSSACLLCVRARTKVGGLSETRPTLRGRRRDAYLLPVAEKRFQTMGFTNENHRLAVSDSSQYSDVGGLLTNSTFADKTVFITGTTDTSRSRHHSSDIVSTPSSPTSLTDPARCIPER